MWYNSERKTNKHSLTFSKNQVLMLPWSYVLTAIEQKKIIHQRKGKRQREMEKGLPGGDVAIYKEKDLYFILCNANRFSGA